MLDPCPMILRMSLINFSNFSGVILLRIPRILRKTKSLWICSLSWGSASRLAEGAIHLCWKENNGYTRFWRWGWGRSRGSRTCWLARGSWAPLAGRATSPALITPAVVVEVFDSSRKILSFFFPREVEKISEKDDLINFDLVEHWLMLVSQCDRDNWWNAWDRVGIFIQSWAWTGALLACCSVANLVE